MSVLPSAPVFITIARPDNPVWLVLAISVVVGLLMVIVFRYTSDQKAIGRAKDRLKAHLLAVRLFQDQLPVVLRAYGQILLGTGRYLRLAFTPLLIAILPITFLIVQLDRYFGAMPFQPGQAFLVEARVKTADSLDQLQLQLPDGLMTSAPAVHVLKENSAVWRVVTQRDGQFDVNVRVGGDSAVKRVVVESGLARLSPIRLRGNFWKRALESAEPAIADSSAIDSIEVNYPARDIHFAWMEWNWIVLFFVVSLIAGFIFKSVFGIQI
jgi:hypothetical protein